MFSTSNKIVYNEYEFKSNNKNMLVVKGAYYYDKESGFIVSPHYTGEYHTVDCDQYMKVEELKNLHGDIYVEECVKNVDSLVTLKGEDYYYAEYSPFYTGEFFLLSDLSSLEFNELENSF